MSRTLKSFGFLVPAILVLIVYANSLHGAFVFDDLAIVISNPEMAHIHTLRDVFRVASGFRSVLILSYALNFYYGARNTVGYHAVNVGLHALNSMLVFFIIKRLAWPKYPTYRVLRMVWIAAMVGSCLFAVHPLLSGAVDYIAARSSILCGTFYFLSILFFLKSKRWWILSAIAAILAWETKQEAVTLPLFLACIYFMRAKRVDWTILATFWAIPALWIALSWKQLASIFGAMSGNVVLMSAGFEPVLAPAMYFRTYITAVAGYILPRMVVPLALSADPYVPVVPHWHSLAFVYSALALIGLGILWWRMRDEKLLSIGFAALVVSPLAAYAFVPMADPIFEYRAYIPMLGIALLAAWLSTRVPAYACICTLLIFGELTAKRAPAWANPISLWEDATIKSPLKARPHFNLGAAYQDAGRNTEAMQEYRRTLEINPNTWVAYSNLGSLEVDAGQMDIAEKDLQKVTTLSPTFVQGWINLGVFHLRQNHPYRAMEFLDVARALSPDDWSVHHNKGDAFMQMGKYPEAIAEYKAAIYQRPEITKLRMALANAYYRDADRPAYEATIAEMKTLGMVK